MQDSERQCKIVQYSAEYLTADGAYHCPVGSIWLFLIEYSNIPYLLNTAKDDYSLFIFDLVGAQAWSPPTPAQRPWSSRASWAMSIMAKMVVWSWSSWASWTSWAWWQIWCSAGHGHREHHERDCKDSEGDQFGDDDWGISFFNHIKMNKDGKDGRSG